MNPVSVLKRTFPSIAALLHSRKIFISSDAPLFRLHCVPPIEKSRSGSLRPLRPKSFFLQGLVAGILGLWLAGGAVAATDKAEELLIGIEPEHNIFDQMQRHRVLAAYLADQLGVKVKLTIMSRYGEVIKRFKALKLDGAFLTPYTATLGIAELNLEPVANPVSLGGESTAQGYIFVRKDSGIRSVTDMEGKSVAFVDPATMEGYLFPLAFLRRHGVADFSSFFDRYHFTGSHASTVFAVLDGRADVGAAKNTVFNELGRNDPSILQELVIIDQSPKVPEITLCLSTEIDQNLRVRLAAALLRMDGTPEGRKVLGQFKALRFAKSSRADFVDLEGIAREARAAIPEQGN